MDKANDKAGKVMTRYELVEAYARTTAEIQMLPIRMVHAQIYAGIKAYRELLESRMFRPSKEGV